MFGNGKTPRFAMLVRVHEAFFHCRKSMIRSGMWEPDKWAPIDGLPSYAQAMKDHGELTNFKEFLESLQSLIERNERQRLY
jgi:predicted pyridoxine 5'-phosphate oxidase superfamily flavin-nucleotide-binding protein